MVIVNKALKYKERSKLSVHLKNWNQSLTGLHGNYSRYIKPKENKKRQEQVKRSSRWNSIATIILKYSIKIKTKDKSEHLLKATN